MSFRAYLLFVVFLLKIAWAMGQSAGTLDNFLNVSGLNGQVIASYIQPDGKILLGGGFTSYNGVAQNRIARLNYDGSLDESFQSGFGANNLVFDIQAQADGKILIAGSFTTYDGVPRAGVARLNPDGSLDKNFVVGSGANVSTRMIQVQSDGKIIYCGNFTTYNGTATNRIFRLNSDGSLDASFNIGTGANDFIRTMLLQADGKILIAGQFTTFNGINQNRIARLNSDGSLDNTFNSGGSGFNGSVFNLLIQPQDGKILVCGVFSTFNDKLNNKILRLQPNGSLDDTFTSPLTQVNTNIMRDMRVQSDKKIVLGGGFLEGSMKFLIRVNENGSLDNIFTIAPNFAINTLEIDKTDKIILGGDFTELGIGTTKIKQTNVAVLLNDGSIDTKFNNGEGFKVDCCTDLEVDVVYPLADGKILVGGNFDSYNGIACSGLVRLHPNGSLDTTFRLPEGADFEVWALKPQSDGKLVLGGLFYIGNDFEDRLIRLHPDGSLDTSFDASTVYRRSLRVGAIEIQSDGKILVGYSNYSRKEPILRFNPDGSVDDSFASSGIDSYLNILNTIKLLPDGKILIGGLFEFYQNNVANGLALLDANGNFMQDFKAYDNNYGIIYTIELQKDNKILLGHSNGMTRLNLDGSLDQTFQVADWGSSGLRLVFAIQIQPDNKIVFGGNFSDFAGRKFLGRLNPDGSLDATFNPQKVGPDGGVRNFLIAPNGKVWLVGDFYNYNQQIRNGMARIYCSVSAIPSALQTSDKQTSSFRLHWQRVQGIQNYEVDVSDDNFLSILSDYKNKWVQDTTLIINNLEPGKKYSCVVRTINEQGTSPNSTIIELVINPLIPQNLKVKALSINQIVLNWDFNPQDNLTYKIQFAQDKPDIFQDITLLSGNTYTHNGLKAGTNYYYRLQAFKNGALSEFSEVVGAKTFSDDIVTGLEEEKTRFKLYPNPGNGQIWLDWNLSKLNIQHIRILNQWGQEVQVFANLDNQVKLLTINTLAWQNGMYYIQLSNQETTLTRKFFKNSP